MQDQAAINFTKPIVTYIFTTNKESGIIFDSGYWRRQTGFGHSFQHLLSRHLPALSSRSREFFCPVQQEDKCEFYEQPQKGLWCFC